MNPWQFLRHEIGGAARSLRYDLNLRRARRLIQRRMTEDTMELPVIERGARQRRLILAGGGVLVATAAVSGYLAIGDSLDALIGGQSDPVSLPDRPGRARPATPTPQPTPSTANVTEVNLPISENNQVPNPPHTTPSPPKGTPPVPTPAPTCTCVTPSPSPTASPVPSPTPTTSPPPAAQPTQPAPPAPSAAAQ